MLPPRTIRQRLLHLNRRETLAALLLLESFIFLLDIDTGATISYAPFLSIPTALAAWWLGLWPALWFVLLSSVARVTDFNAMRPPHSSPLMLLYDLLQSAAFYGCVALLVLMLRRQRDHLLHHARQIRATARQERHRRWLDSAIRRAVPTDVPAILKLTHTAGEGGSFDEVVTDSVHQAALGASFHAGILNGSALRDLWTGGQSTVPIEFWVTDVEGEVRSFMMILGVDQKQILPRELHAMVVDPRYRGQGLGNLMVDFFCTHYKQRTLIAACQPGSTMRHMLLKRGFHHLAQSDKGYELLRRPA